jgi:RNase P protein component
MPDLVPGYDVVIISRPALANQSFAALLEALNPQLRHARLLTHTGTP